MSVAGGYWTGSSAVVDLLAEHARCRVIPGEFVLFSFGQFFDEVTRPLLAQVHPDEELFEGNLDRFRLFNQEDRFTMARALGRRACGPLRFYAQAFFGRRGGLAKRLGQDYGDACDRLVQALRRAPGVGNAATIRRELSTLFDAAAAGIPHEGAAGAPLGVFDQVVAPPYIPSAADAVPHMRFINVDRDWRDQYISMRPWARHIMAVNRKLGVRPWGETLAEMADPDPMRIFLRLRRRIETEKARQATWPHVLWLRFEEIVLDPRRTAEQIFGFLGLDPASHTPGGHFHREVSAKRVGKWRWTEFRGSLVERELKEMEAELGVPDPISALLR